MEYPSKLLWNALKRKSEFLQKDHFDTLDVGDEEDADEFIGERCKNLLMYSITCLSANTTLC